MFENLTLLPVQHRTDPHLTPMQRLAWALLDDLLTVQHFARKNPTSLHWRRLAEQDAAWLAGAPAPLPFDLVCDALGLDQRAVRDAYEKRLADRPHWLRTAPQAVA